MMRCAECGKTFRWGRLFNTTKQVVLEHCPDPNPRPAAAAGGAYMRRGWYF